MLLRTKPTNFETMIQCFKNVIFPVKVSLPIFSSALKHSFHLFLFSQGLWKNLGKQVKASESNVVLTGYSQG